MVELIVDEGKARGIIAPRPPGARDSSPTVLATGGHGNVLLSTNAMGCNGRPPSGAYAQAYFGNPRFTQIHPTHPQHGDQQSKLTSSESLRNDGRICPKR